MLLILKGPLGLFRHFFTARAVPAGDFLIFSVDSLPQRGLGGGVFERITIPREY